MKKIFIGLICIFLLCQTLLANQVDENEWKKFYNQSSVYLFNCEYDKAIDYLEKAKELNPDNPVIYWRLTLAFWFKAEHDKSLKKEDKKQLEKEFNRIFDKGVALCVLNGNDPNEPEILFYLGGLYGNKVLFKQAMGESNSSLLENTNKSREYLEKIKETENFYYEACGYLGIFNYGPIIVPGLFRSLAKLKGYKWNEDKGLQQIGDAIGNSRYNDDIKFLYEGILLNLVKKKKYRNRIQEAIDLVEDLLRKYPRNSFLEKDLETLKKFANK